MPNLVLMSALVTRAIQLADMVGDDSILNPEWKSLLSEGFGELYEDTGSVGLRYWETIKTFTTDGTNFLPEPDDQLAIIDRLELVTNTTTGKCRRLKRIGPQERATWSGRTGQPRAYELADGRYYLYPTPPAGLTITLRYIGQCPDLTNYADGQLVDCVTAYGRRFLQLHAAIQAMAKSRRDASDLIAERELCRKNHKEWAADRAFSDQPVMFTDVDDDCDGIPDGWDY